MAYRVLLIKLGSRARATRPGFGAVGHISRVIPEHGMYWLDSSTGIHPVRTDSHEIRLEPPCRLVQYLPERRD